MKHIAFIAALIILCLNGKAQAQPIQQAHAHNDYENPRPLFLALANGFTSIEVDVHEISGKLYVSHDHPTHLSDSMLFENLYMDPLVDFVNAHDGYVFPGYEEPLILMVDVKTGAETSVGILNSLLAPYDSIFCPYNQMNHCKVKVIVSGNRPVEAILDGRYQWCGLDGRAHELGRGITSDIMPVVSADYKNIPSLNGMEWLNTREKVYGVVLKSHDEQKKVRFWGAPDDQKTWTRLLDAGVDYISTDKVEEFSHFMLSDLSVHK